MNIFESVARQRPVSLSVPGSTSTVLRVRKGARQKFLAGNESRGNRSGSSFVLLAWKWQFIIIIQGYTRSIQPKFSGNIREVTPRTETRKSEQLVFGTSNSGSASRDQSSRIRCISSFLANLRSNPDAYSRSSLLSLFRLSRVRNELFPKRDIPPFRKL